MSKEEIKQYLKDNLEAKVIIRNGYVRVEIYLEKELVSEDYDSLPES